MLTDDDLIRELETAFRADTAGLRYSGKVPAPLFLGVQPPADAQEVDLSGSPEGRWLVQAWVGTSPEIGKAGLFVRTRESDLGEYAFFAADEITVEDWTRMIQTGSNR